MLTQRKLFQGRISAVARLLLLVLPMLLSLHHSELQAQRILDFDRLSIDNGFSSSKANAIIQDQKGFIWIGTWNGLNRYDGYNVEVFKPGFHDTSSISNREVSALLEDHAGNIWVGTTSGLNKYNPVNKEWDSYPFQQRIISLLEDEDQMLWIGTWYDGLYRLNPKNGEIDHYLEDNVISDIFEDSRNNFWVATYNGLVDFDRNTASYTRFLPDERDPSKSVSHLIVTDIIESHNGDIWLGTWDGGLNRMKFHPNRDSLKFIHYRAGEGSRPLSSDAIYRLFYDDFDNLWIGTWDEGLSLLQASQQGKMPGEAEFQNYKSDLRNPYGLSGNNISSLYVDRAGILWVGSSRIDRTSILNTGVSRYMSTSFSGDVFVENPIRSLCKCSSQLWAGSQESIHLFNLNAERRYELEDEFQVPSYVHLNTEYRANSVLSILRDDNGLWVGTDDAGLLYFPGNERTVTPGGSFRYFNTRTDPALPGNKIFKLVKSDRYPGVIWIGSLQNGFARFDWNGGNPEVTQYRAGNDKSSLSDNNIRAIVEDKDGLVWIGTQNGLNCFDPEKGSFRKFYYEFGDSTSINDNVINVLFEDRDGNLWIGSNAGLNKKISSIDESGKENIRFAPYSDIEDISGEIITNLLEDNSGNLWIGIYKGVICMNKANTNVKKAYFSKEFQHLIVERNSAIRSADGYLIFPGASGFISFHPDSLYQEVRVPQVCITDLLISNTSIGKETTGVKNNSELVALPYLNSLELSYKAKFLTFVFSAMDYKDPKRNKYSYILEGLEDQWIEIGATNTATYTNLKPGDYVFKVKATNSDGVESEEAAELHFSISRPWWASIVALGFYIAIFIGMLYFFNQYSIIGVREKGRIMIEHMEYEKEHEVNEMKSLFFTNITHEFRTPLTLILGPVEELLKASELNAYTRRQAELIQKNAQRLLRLVNQLMEFRKVEKGKIQMQFQRINVVETFNELYEAFKSLADSRKIDFSMTIEEKQIMAVVDVEKFEKALYNLLSNAFKYSDDESKISFHAKVIEGNERRLRIEIEDAGIGIPEEYHEKVFERFFQVNQKSTQSTGGIGLYLSKTFIEQHKGDISLESEPGQGTCFRVSIPLDQEDFIETALPESEKLAEVVQAGESEELRLSNDATENGMPTVLIVEDDKELNEFICSGLSSEFIIQCAFDGKEGLQAARNIHPDIIITDIMMPEMDGIEMGLNLRKDLSTSHIPLVYLTAKTMQEDEIRGLEIGAVDYIFKPFNLVSLKLKVQNILENRKRIQEKFKQNQLLDPVHIELTSLDEKFLLDAVQSVNNNLDDPTFDVEKFSVAVGMSPNQAYRKIKALTGQTAKEFIRNQRLKIAADLLLQKRRSISEIIYMVGFSSPSYFTRCFKEYYGCTPKEFIEQGGKTGGSA